MPIVQPNTLARSRGRGASPRAGPAAGLLLAVAALAPAARAQCTPGWTPGPHAPGVDNFVRAVAALPDGDALVAGVFTTAGGLPAPGLARFDAATRTWAGITPGPVSSGSQGTVSVLEPLPDGRVLVAASFSGFTSINGVTTWNIALYNPATGEFSPSGSEMAHPAVWCATVLPGGDVLAAGNFRTVADGPWSCLARFHPPTNTWTIVGNRESNGLIHALAPAPDGTVIVVGAFTGIGGTPINRVARYDPATDAWSPVGTFPQNSFEVRDGVVLPGGEIIVGGLYYPDYAMRFDPATSTWSPLLPGSGTSAGVNNYVYDVNHLPDGRVLLSGSFSQAGGAPADRLVRYDPAARTFEPFPPGTTSDVECVAMLPGGDFYAAGWFSSIGGTSVDCVARWDNAAGRFVPPTAGLNAPVRALVPLPGGDVLAAGDFQAVGLASAAVARYHHATRAWSVFAPGRAQGRIYTLAILSGGDVIVGGSFTSVAGTPLNRVARYSPATGAWTPLGAGAGGVTNGSSPCNVYAIAELPGGDIVAAGQFNRAGTVGALSIARFNPSTGLWSAMAPGVTGSVHALALLPGGDLAVGGNFRLGTTQTYGLARYTPATGAWSPLGPALDGAFDSILPAPDGSIIVGGGCSSCTRYTHRLDPAGAAWTPMQIGWPAAMARLPGGDLIAVGRYFRPGDGFNYDDAPGFAARLDQATGQWTLLATDQIFGGHAVAPLPGGDVLIGGDFEAPGGVVSAFAARYSFGAPACPADHNGASGVELLDIFAFLQDWFAGNPRADFNHAGGVELLDIFAFLTAWFAGC